MKRKIFLVVGLICCLLMVACNSESNVNNNGNTYAESEEDSELESSNVWQEYEVDELKETYLGIIDNQNLVEDNSTTNSIGTTYYNLIFQNNSTLPIEYFSLSLRTENGYSWTWHSDFSNIKINPGDKYQVKGIDTDDISEEEFSTKKIVEVQINVVTNDGSTVIIEYEPENDTMRLNGFNINSLVGQPKSL